MTRVRHGGKRIALLAVGCSLFLGAGGTARAATSKYSTEITVGHVEVGRDGSLSVSGRVQSDRRACQQFKFIDLLRVRNGPDKVLDTGISSLPGGAWAVRAGAGTVDGSRFSVRSQRAAVEITRIGDGGHEHHRTIICRADRAHVEVPVSAPLAAVAVHPEAERGGGRLSGVVAMSDTITSPQVAEGGAPTRSGSNR